MSRSKDYEERTEKLLEPIMKANQFELVDVEYVKEGGNCFLRAFVDKEGGITIDDCELVSRELSDLLDKEDYISESYILEVSSPGLGRQLKKEKDFKRSIGEKVEVKLYKAVSYIDEKGKKASTKELCGILTTFDEESITLEFEDETQETILKKDIAIVKLALEF